ncbi:MAG: hypothetical protein R2764_04030 [Bacteroidales bacterium]
MPTFEIWKRSKKHKVKCYQVVEAILYRLNKDVNGDRLPMKQFLGVSMVGQVSIITFRSGAKMVVGKRAWRHILEGIGIYLIYQVFGKWHTHHQKGRTGSRLPRQEKGEDQQHACADR